MRQLPGVISTTTGFAGGHVTEPTYQQVCTKTTGHTEVVRVVYDLRKLSTRELLTTFFTLHDFTVDRRSNGGQYRSVIFTDPSENNSTKQESIALMLLDKLCLAGYTPSTEVASTSTFFPAESRHQQYCSAKGISPKRRSVSNIIEILTF